MVESSGYAEFELDLIAALQERLPPEFAKLTGLPLTDKSLEGIPADAQGVYMLLDRGTPTYIGKTDASHGFQDRLHRHYLSLSARKNVDLGTISFKAVRVMVFTVVNVESMLIKTFIGDNPLAWQYSGFGSNDPGHHREKQEPSEFDVNHPINIDLPHGLVPAGPIGALSLLRTLKECLPFDFRYETDRTAAGKPKRYTIGHADHRATDFVIPRSNMTLRELLAEVVVQQLPTGWVATVFPGRVILYKEDDAYVYSLESIRK